MTCLGFQKLLRHEYITTVPHVFDRIYIHVLTERYVTGTGNTVITAVNVLQDHGVKQENIIVLNLFCTPPGNALKVFQLLYIELG